MKPYALLCLRKLKLYTFATEQEWRDAIADFTRTNRLFLILKYHHSAEVYQVMEPLGKKPSESAPPFSLDELFQGFGRK